MMNTMEDKSLCGLIKFHSARLAEVAKDTEELQASIDNEVAEAYQKGFEDGKAVNDKGCEGCKYEGNPNDNPCKCCSNGYPNQWTSKSDKIEVGDEVVWKEDENVVIVVTSVYTADNMEWCDGVCKDGRTYSILTKNARKTGRHFDIDKILEEMRND